MILSLAGYPEKLLLIERKNNMLAIIFNSFYKSTTLIFVKIRNNDGSHLNILMTQHLMTTVVLDGSIKKLMRMATQESWLEKD